MATAASTMSFDSLYSDAFVSFLQKDMIARATAEGASATQLAQIQQTLHEVSAKVLSCIHSIKTLLAYFQDHVNRTEEDPNDIIMQITQLQLTTTILLKYNAPNQLSARSWQCSLYDQVARLQQQSMDAFNFLTSYVFTVCSVAVCHCILSSKVVSTTTSTISSTPSWDRIEKVTTETKVINTSRVQNALDMHAQMFGPSEIADLWTRRDYMPSDTFLHHPNLTELLTSYSVMQSFYHKVSCCVHSTYRRFEQSLQA